MLRVSAIEDIDKALSSAQRDKDVKVLILKGAGDNFGGEFDFSSGLEHYANISEGGYDRDEDLRWVSDHYLSYIPKFMGLWRGLKPTIAKVYGYAVGRVLNSPCVPIFSLTRTAPAYEYLIPGSGAAT